MTDIFKAYDVRGIYPSDINEDIVYNIGRAVVEYLDAKEIAIGYDNRISSPSLTEALAKGITDAGANVIDLGLLSTPMLYFASSKLQTDGAIMITASHNPGEYNGLKFCRKNAVPMGLASGLSEIRDLVHAGNFRERSHKGSVTSHDIKKEYTELLASYAEFNGKHFSLAVDTAHAMGVLELPIYQKLPGVTLTKKLYDTLELPGICPHEANPLQLDTLTELQDAVRDAHVDMGIAYDGDADRIGFVDELGRIVPMDLVTALLAEALLLTHKKSTILYDLRSSRVVKEVIEKFGGVAGECNVGHANIKKQMLTEGALFAGEVSGHYYFALAGYTAEMGTLPAILLMNVMARTGKKLSTLVDEVTLYAHSGEINMRVENAHKIFEKIKAHYADGNLSERDGIKITYPEWWFSLRTSNTEPLLRLNLEANTHEQMEKKKNELIALINAPL